MTRLLFHSRPIPHVLRHLVDHPTRHVVDSRLLSWRTRHLGGIVRHASTQSAGLYGFPDLQTPADLAKFSETARKRATDVKYKIRSDYTAAKTVVQGLDEISDIVTTVLDACELCRSSHPSEEWVKAANEAFNDMHGFVSRLNMDKKLYDPLQQAMSRRPSTVLTKEEVSVANALKSEFEKDGIHLSKYSRAKVADIQYRLSKLAFVSAQAQSKLQTSPPTLAVSLVTLKHSIRPTYLNALMRHVEGQDLTWRQMLFKKASSTVYIPLDDFAQHVLIHYCSDFQIRNGVYEKLGQLAAQNSIPYLTRLSSLRHSLATELGFKSYLHYALTGCCFKTPEAVMDLLENLGKFSHSYAINETSVTKRAGDMDMDMQQNYHFEFAKREVEERFLLDGRERNDFEAEVTRFFHVSQTVQGLCDLCEELFGLQVKDVTAQMAPVEKYCEDLKKLHFLENGELIGTLYLDLTKRPNKLTQAAHFQIVSGRRLQDGSYQAPSAALVCNLNKGYLTHGEVRVLFHEFGHALHGILSRTEYQFLSGTRGERDFVEVPSLLFEQFASDPRILKRFARHSITGEVISDDQIEMIRKLQNVYPASTLQDQLLLSIFDQKLFLGEQKNVGALFHDVATNYSVVKSPEVAFAGFRMSHLTNYGGTYYSYIVSRMAADQMWEALFKEDPLSRESGRRLREEYLQYGGSKPSLDLVERVIGSKFSYDTYLRLLRQQSWGFLTNVYESTELPPLEMLETNKDFMSDEDYERFLQFRKNSNIKIEEDENRDPTE